MPNPKEILVIADELLYHDVISKKRLLALLNSAIQPLDATRVVIKKHQRSIAPKNAYAVVNNIIPNNPRIIEMETLSCSIPKNLFMPKAKPMDKYVMTMYVIAIWSTYYSIESKIGVIY